MPSGSSGVDAGVATLWRHLAHWPALLALIHGAFAPLRSRGLIAEANARLVALSSAEIARMAHLRLTSPALSRQACATITGYVGSPSRWCVWSRSAMPLLSGWIDNVTPSRHFALHVATSAVQRWQQVALPKLRLITVSAALVLEQLAVWL